MSDVCAITIVIKSDNPAKLSRLKDGLESNIKAGYGDKTIGNDKFILRDVSIGSDPREGENRKTVVISCWVDWALEHEECIELFKFFKQSVNIFDDFDCTVYYEELGSDQYGMYTINGRTIEDTFLSVETLGRLREERDRIEEEEGEDAAWDKYHEALNRELLNTDIEPVRVYTFSCPENHCPACGSIDLDTDPMESDYLGDGATIWFPCECNSCGHRFDQLYKIAYQGTEDR